MTNIETVQKIYADFGRQDVPAILEVLAEDVDWEYAYPDRGVPWLQPRHGRAAVGGFFQALAQLDFAKFAITSVLGQDRLVVALAEVEFVVRTSGKRVSEIEEVHIWHFDERGRVKRFRHCVDTVQHQQAV